MQYNIHNETDSIIKTLQSLDQVEGKIDYDAKEGTFQKVNLGYYAYYFGKSEVNNLPPQKGLEILKNRIISLSEQIAKTSSPEEFNVLMEKIEKMQILFLTANKTLLTKVLPAYKKGEIEDSQTIAIRLEIGELSKTFMKSLDPVNRKIYTAAKNAQSIKTAIEKFPFYEKLLNSVSNVDCKLKILEFLENIPKKERAEFIKFSENFTYGLEDEEKLAVLEFVHKEIGLFEMDEFIICNRLLIDNKQPGDTLKVLQKIKSISTDREKNIDHAFNYFKLSTSSADRLKIIDLIESSWEDKERLETLDSFLKVSPVDSELLEFIKLIPTYDLKEYLLLSNSLFVKYIDSKHKIEFFKIIERIGINQLKDYLNLVESPLFQYMDSKNKMDFLKTFEKIGITELKECFSFEAEIFSSDMSIPNRLEILNALTKVPNETRSEAILFIDQFFSFAFFNEKLKVIEIFQGVDKDDIIHISNELKKFGASKKSSKEVISLFEALVKIPAKERSVYLHFLLSKMDNEKGLILETLNKIPPEDWFSCISFVNMFEYPTTQEMIVDLSGFQKIKKDERLETLSYLEILYPKNTSNFEKYDILRCIDSVPRNQRKQLTEDLVPLLRMKHLLLSKSGPETLQALLKIKPFHLSDVVHHTANFLRRIGDEEIVLELLKFLPIVPKNERADFVENLDIVTLELVKSITGSRSASWVHYYLLPQHLKEVEALKSHDSNKEDYRQALLTSLNEKIFSSKTHPITLIKLGKYIVKRQRSLKIGVQHPLVKRAEIIATIKKREKGFDWIFDQLEMISEETTNFKPLTMAYYGQNLSININQLKKLSSVSIVNRLDLPEKANSEAWNGIIDALQKKVVVDGRVNDKARQALNLIDMTWENFETPVFKDPEKLFSRLLESTDDPVSDVEAKWRAVVNNILDKSTNPQEGNYFTEQEEVLLRTIHLLQGCTQGKTGGIDFAYQDLEEKYHYKIELKKALQVHEQQESQEKEIAIQFVTKFINDQPVKTKEVMAENLRKLVNQNYLENSVIISPILASHYWEEDDDIHNLDSVLSIEGALELIDIANKEAVRPQVLQFLNQAVRNFMMTKFMGTDEMMKELTGKNEDVFQPVHQAAYLKNLIGSYAGIGSDLEVDLYTHVLSKVLVNRDRDEVLAIFFKHVTPEVMLEALLKTIKNESVENKQMLKLFLRDSGSPNENISMESVIKLLQEAEFIV